MTKKEIEAIMGAIDYKLIFLTVFGHDVEHDLLAEARHSLEDMLGDE